MEIPFAAHVLWKIIENHLNERNEDQLSIAVDLRSFIASFDFFDLQRLEITYN